MNETSLIKNVFIVLVEVVVAHVVLLAIGYGYYILKDRREKKNFRKLSEESA